MSTPSKLTTTAKVVSSAAFVAGCVGTVASLVLMGFAASLSAARPIEPSPGMPLSTTTAIYVWGAAIVYIIMFSVVNCTACRRVKGSCRPRPGSTMRNVAYVCIALVAVAVASLTSLHSLTSRRQPHTCFQCPSCQEHGWDISTYTDDIVCTNHAPVDNPNCHCYSTTSLSSYDTCYCSLTAAAQGQPGVRKKSACYGSPVIGKYSCVSYTHDAFFSSCTGAAVTCWVIAAAALVLLVAGGVGATAPTQLASTPLAKQGHHHDSTEGSVAVSYSSRVEGDDERQERLSGSNP